MKKLLVTILFGITFSSWAFAQLTVKGYVTDKDNLPLPGVNIVIKGSTQGTITDVDGHYSLSDIPADGILVFSFLGMQTQEIKVGEQTTINISLLEETESLDEVVVVGYGSVKRVNLTGAVVDIKAAEIEDIPASNLSETLQGRLAGVKIIQATGKPGSETPLEIRTSSSYGLPETPLFVIDGIIYESQDQFDLLDPTEVESISVLKDASAAVYGARAAGGVVVVKTKSGREGMIKINYSGSYGINHATQIPEMLSGYDHAIMMNEIYDHENGKYRGDPNFEKKKEADYRYYTEDELEYILSNENDWLREMWQDAFQTRQTLNISGGSEKVRYYAGGSYYFERGNIPDLFYNKYSLRTKLDADITKQITISFGLNLNHNDSQQPYYSEESQEGVLRDTYKQLLIAPRWVPPTINDMPVYNNMVTWNPYGLNQSGSYKKSSGNHSTINTAIEYRIPFIEGLKFNGQWSYDLSSGRGKRYGQDYYMYNFVPTGTHNHILTEEVRGDPILYNNREALQEGTSTSSSYQLNVSASYTRSFGKHDIYALLLYEQSESQSDGFNTTLTGAAIRGYDYMWAFNQSNISNSPSASETGRLGYIGRLNYSYAQRYILEATFRYEASQKFHPDNRWGFFPAASVGWIISEEKFFKNNINFINFLKIRGSAGLVGNDNVSAFQYRYLYSANQTGAIFGNQLTNAIEAKNNGVISPDLTWQKTRSYNLGADFRFLQGKIDFAIDYYYRFTYDILTRRNSTVPTTAGYAKLPNENYGEMFAKGLELELGYNNNFLNDFQYSIKGIFSWDYHRKLKVFQSPAVYGRWDDQLLNDPSNQPGLICLGIIRTQEEVDAILAENPDYTIDGKAPEVGMLNYKDIRGENYSDGADGKIDGNDRTIIAEYSSPPYHYGFTLGLSWKSIKLNMTFSGAFGHQEFINKDEQALPTSASNVFAFWGDYWSDQNPDGSMPRPYEYGYEGQVSTFWMRNGHTLRLSNLNLSYTLPDKLSSKINIPQLRVYFTATNLWTIISPFKYKDPSVSRAYDYPMMSTYNFGLNITL
jgi:TonB-linked SusC/RagA family outer membrane protein